MQATCDRCGRLVSSAPPAAGAGARGAATCACGHALPSAGAAAPPRETAPLPPPQEGNLEVDPWSLPAPADGYENLDLDDPPGPGETAPAARGGEVPLRERPVPAPDAGPPAEPSPADPAARRPRPRGVVIAAAAAAIVVGVGAWALLGRSSAPGGAPVKVKVTQEVPWSSAPPLAPVDPSYVERARPEPLPARPEAAARLIAAPSRAPRATGSPAAPAATPEPAPGREPAEAVSPPELVSEPPAREAPPPPPAVPAAASVSIPLPPPPVLAPRPAAAEAPSRARTPMLQTRSCVEDALRVPRSLENRLPPEVVLQVAVGEDGRPGDVSYAGNPDPLLRSAIAAAVRSCRFTPGADARGRPAAGAATMRLRFE